MLPSQKEDIENELKRLLEIAEFERVLTREEKYRLNQIIKIIDEEEN